MPGSGTAFSSKLISLFPTKWGTLQLEGIVVAIRCKGGDENLESDHHVLAGTFQVDLRLPF